MIQAVGGTVKDENCSLSESCFWQFKHCGQSDDDDDSNSLGYAPTCSSTVSKFLISLVFLYIM